MADIDPIVCSELDAAAIQEWIEQHRRLPFKNSTDKLEQHLAQQMNRTRKALFAQGMKRLCADSGKAVMQDDRKKRSCAESEAAAMQDADKKRSCAESGAAASSGRCSGSVAF